MYCPVYFVYGSIPYSFVILSYSDYSYHIFEGIFALHCYKLHNHSYFFKIFFYDSKKIFVSPHYRSKSKLHSAIQNLLQEELNNVVQ